MLSRSPRRRRRVVVGGREVEERLRSTVSVIDPTLMSHRSFHDPAVTMSHSWCWMSASTPSRFAISCATSTSKPFHSLVFTSYHDCGLYFWSVATRMHPVPPGCARAGRLLGGRAASYLEPVPWRWLGSGSLDRRRPRGRGPPAWARSTAARCAHLSSFRGAHEAPPPYRANYRRVTTVGQCKGRLDRRALGAGLRRDRRPREVLREQQRCIAHCG